MLHLPEVENLTKRFGGLTAVNNVKRSWKNNTIGKAVAKAGSIHRKPTFNLIAGYLQLDLGEGKLKAKT